MTQSFSYVIIKFREKSFTKRGVMPVGYKKMPSEYYDFHIGTSCRAYEIFGCHQNSENYIFRVWAPNADKVFLVGDFNGWADTHEMARVTRGGIF